MGKKSKEREQAALRERIMEAAEESLVQDKFRESSYRGKRLGWFDRKWLIDHWLDDDTGVDEALNHLVQSGQLIEATYWKGAFVEYRINEDAPVDEEV